MPLGRCERAESERAMREATDPLPVVGFGGVVGGLDDERIIAGWRGEAAKAWWCNLTETQRQQIELMKPAEIFSLGWQCGRAKSPNTKVSHGA